MNDQKDNLIKEIAQLQGDCSALTESLVRKQEYAYPLTAEVLSRALSLMRAQKDMLEDLLEEYS